MRNLRLKGISQPPHSLISNRAEILPGIQRLYVAHLPVNQVMIRGGQENHRQTVLCLPVIPEQLKMEWFKLHLPHLWESQSILSGHERSLIQTGLAQKETRRKSHFGPL